MSNENPKIIYSPAVYEEIASALKSIHMDYYFYVAFMYHSGYYSSHFLGKTNAEIASFLSKNENILPQYFVVEVKTHMLGKDPEEVFLKSKFDNDEESRPLCKRSAENAVVRLCEKLGYPNVGSYTLIKSFVWNQFRHSGYQLETINNILRSRRRPPFGSVDKLLEYCGITQKELDDDIHSNESFGRNSLCAACKEITDFFQDAYFKIANNGDTPSELIGYESVIFQTQSIIKGRFPKDI